LRATVSSIKATIGVVAGPITNLQERSRKFGTSNRRGVDELAAVGTLSPTQLFGHPYAQYFTPFSTVEEARWAFHWLNRLSGVAGDAGAPADAAAAAAFVALQSPYTRQHS